MRLALLAAVCICVAVPASAEVLVAKGSEYRYAIAEVDEPATRLMEPVMAALDGATRTRVELPAVLGTVQPPAGFPLVVPPQRGRAPFVANASARCECTPMVPGDDRRIAALYASTEFYAANPSGWSSLTVRLRYRDAAIIWINGREVLRAGLAANANPEAAANRRRGPEWETFAIAVIPGLLATGANRIAVEVRPSATRTAPDFDLELVAAGRAHLVRGPVVQRMSSSKIVVRYTTDVPVRSALEWGHTQGLGRVVAAGGGEVAIEHRVELEGLLIGEPVFYRVVVAQERSPLYRVQQWPASGSTTRFAVYGDMRGGHDIHRRIVESLDREPLDLVLVTGDLVLRGSDGGDWQRFFAVAAKLLAAVPYFPVAGNHDLGRSGAERRLMVELFELPPAPAARPAGRSWYSFDVGDVHFVMLDSNHYADEAQEHWLEDDLAAARGRRAIFAFTHDGPYSRGLHGGNAAARERYVPLLQKFGVTMLFSGHDHLYQRGEIGGLRYVVTGGGGAPLYSVRCGNKGQRRCEVRDGAQRVAKSYHYLVVTVRDTHVELCTKYPDGTPLEPCVSYTL